MAILSLPVELVLEIIEMLDPWSTFNVAICCKSLWSLCQPMLQTHSNERASTPSCQLYLKMLRNVIDDPTRGWYYRSLLQPNTGMWDQFDRELRHKTVELVQHIASINGLGMDKATWRVLSPMYEVDDDRQASLLLLIHRLPDFTMSAILYHCDTYPKSKSVTGTLCRTGAANWIFIDGPTNLWADTCLTYPQSEEYESGRTGAAYSQLPQKKSTMNFGSPTSRRLNYIWPGLTGSLFV
ncbi:hypothetical protein M011DRAFT_462329 [Sporormia fimetaria CBS 119925]|uniref:F-box domain-containing protein n=1 Tax=Sporormia fimetaria CBS 119925 TaxID=1340428 RepID=A0A6A6V007_9PLEO|nr:hypothetical protein M011DRAFT_462329 [Sporormia fimetaria CBS 119925]